MSHLGHPNTVKLPEPPEFTTIEKVIGLYRPMNSGDYKGVVLFGRKIPGTPTRGSGDFPSKKDKRPVTSRYPRPAEL